MDTPQPRPDEPRFLLLGRDSAAPEAVRMWCLRRLKLKRNTMDDQQITEAYAIAVEMEKYQAQLSPIKP